MGEPVEEDLEQPGVGRLVGRAGDDDQVARGDLLDQLGDARVTTSRRARGRGRPGRRRGRRRPAGRRGAGRPRRCASGLGVADDDGDRARARHEAAARWPPKGTDARRGDGRRVGPQAALLEDRQHALAEPVGPLEVRVGREDELVDAERGVLLDPVGDLLVAADQRGAGTAADQADAGPDVGVDLQAVARAAVQGEHPFAGPRTRSASGPPGPGGSRRRRCPRAGGRPRPRPPRRCRG